MKKTLTSISLLLLTFLTFAQNTASIKDVSSAQNNHKIQTLTQFKALDFMKDPYKLLDYWGDESLSISKYSVTEKDFQLKLNKSLSDEFVMAYSPDSEGEFPNNYLLPFEQRNIDFEEITPYTWKWVRFQIQYEDGSFDEVKICRPNWWLINNGATEINKQVYLSIPETGINGQAVVVKIFPCQLDTRLLKLNRKDDYLPRPVTGTFKHHSGEVWDYYFSEGDPVGSTDNHPFYSIDRKEYVPIGELKIGEKVKSISGKEIVLVKSKKRSKPEPVFNLEIYRDHNYSVGSEGILVHNTYLSDVKNLFLKVTTFIKIGSKQVIPKIDTKNLKVFASGISDSDIRSLAESLAEGQTLKEVRVGSIWSATTNDGVKINLRNEKASGTGHRWTIDILDSGIIVDNKGKSIHLELKFE